MKSKILLACIVCFVFAVSRADPVGTAFTYQGQLSTNGAPANGTYDFFFTLYTNNTTVNQINSILAAGISVTNGIFTTTMDFGSIFNGTAYWLGISVRTNGAVSFTPLTPRQPLTPTPNALFAISAATSTTASNVVNGGVTSAAIASSTITGGNIATGQVVKSLNGLQDTVILAAGNNVGLTTNGNTLTIAASGGGGSSWSLTGNAGTSPGLNYVGTSDNQPVEVHVNGMRALRLEPGTNGAPNLIGGSLYNVCDPGVAGSFIGGGGATNWPFQYPYYGPSTNRISANVSTICGGYGQNIQQASDGSAIGGGMFNVIEGNALLSTIAGGSQNTIHGSGNPGNGTIGCFIGGGLQNTTISNAYYATIPGGVGCVAGYYAFAAGCHAKATNSGAFLWADSSNPDFYSTNNNEFAVRATGGFRFVSGLDIITHNITSGVTLDPGSSSWATICDRNLKKNFQPVDAGAVLDKLAAIPIQQWNYKWENDTDVPNIGPMAQDFKHAFYPGRDDKGISTLEFDGVELAAIQGLNQKLEEKEARIQEQAGEIKVLKQDLAELKKLVQTIAEKK